MIFKISVQNKANISVSRNAMKGKARWRVCCFIRYTFSTHHPPTS